MIFSIKNFFSKGDQILRKLNCNHRNKNLKLCIDATSESYQSTTDFTACCINYLFSVVKQQLLSESCYVLLAFVTSKRKSCSI